MLTKRIEAVISLGEFPSIGSATFAERNRDTAVCSRDGYCRGSNPIGISNTGNARSVIGANFYDEFSICFPHLNPQISLRTRMEQKFYFCCNNVHFVIPFRCMKKLQYHLIFRPEPEGGFTVVVPALPGCITYGRTISDAKRMASDAIRGYIASLKRHGEPIPSDNESFIAAIDFPLSRRSSVHA